MNFVSGKSSCLRWKPHTQIHKLSSTENSSLFYSGSPEQTSIFELHILNFQRWWYRVVMEVCLWSEKSFVLPMNSILETLRPSIEPENEWKIEKVFLCSVSKNILYQRISFLFSSVPDAWWCWMLLSSACLRLRISEIPFSLLSDSCVPEPTPSSLSFLDEWKTFASRQAAETCVLQTFYEIVDSRNPCWTFSRSCYNETINCAEAEKLSTFTLLLLQPDAQLRTTVQYQQSASLWSPMGDEICIFYNNLHRFGETFARKNNWIYLSSINLSRPAKNVVS